MSMYPYGDKLDDFPSRFVLVNLAARRAAQIREGAPILVETSSSHPLTIALEEIAEGAVKPVISPDEMLPKPVETLETLDFLAGEAAGDADLASLTERLERDGGDLGELVSLEDALINEPAKEFDDEVIALEALAEIEKPEPLSAEDELEEPAPKESEKVKETSE